MTKRTYCVSKRTEFKSLVSTEKPGMAAMPVTSALAAETGRSASLFSLAQTANFRLSERLYVSKNKMASAHLCTRVHIHNIQQQSYFSVVKSQNI